MFSDSYINDLQLQSQVFDEPEETDGMEIPLTMGKVAVVDESDFERLSRWKWHARFQKRRQTWYAGTNHTVDGVRGPLYMHRYLMQPAADMNVDHRDGDGLNNRRSNLRIATPQQNQFNAGPRRDNTSGHKGVMWHKASRKWAAVIQINRKKIHLGTFIDKSEAVAAYAKAAEQYHGEFARTDKTKDESPIVG